MKNQYRVQSLVFLFASILGWSAAMIDLSKGNWSGFLVLFIAFYFLFVAVKAIDDSSKLNK